jgi:protein-S-isoprenylcysteine O-methyltransferase Ste14
VLVGERVQEPPPDKIPSLVSEVKVTVPVGVVEPLVAVSVTVAVQDVAWRPQSDLARAAAEAATADAAGTSEMIDCMHVVDFIVLVAWVIFWIYWVTASIGVKAGRTRWARLAGIRVVIVLLVLVLVRAKVFKGQTITTDPWLEGAGLAIFVTGLAVAVWARVYLGRNWGTPMSQKVDPELVTTGPYRKIRHPIYSGIILAMVGTAVAVSWYWLVAVALVGGYFVYSAVMEERYMTQLFPDAYPHYKRSTKMLVPFVF